VRDLPLRKDKKSLSFCNFKSLRDGSLDRTVCLGYTMPGLFDFDG
jgi:hypothetical protein